jgi:flagellar motor switch protein FliM
MLSQAEIDALLSGAIEIESTEGSGSLNLAEMMGGGGEQATPVAPPPTSDAEKKIQTYNFWSPDRFSKDQMRAVELVHEDLAERLTTSLPSFLRVSLRPRLVHTEQGRFVEFLKDFPQNTLFHMITLAPLPGQIVLTISPSVCISIIEQRLGGKVEGHRRDRTLTDIDQSLLRGLIEHMLNDLKAAWSKVAAIEPNLEDSTINQHWVQMLMGNDRVMLLTFELTLQGGTGTMNIYIPFTTLKPIANVLNPHVWISGRKEKAVDQLQRQTALDNLSQVELPICVYLGKTVLSLKEVVNLSIGDVIPLDTAVDDFLTMQVADNTYFATKVGKSGKYLAVQVIAPIKSPGAPPENGSEENE